MKRKLLSIYRASGDASIGKTLIRLARLAVSAHQYETTMELRHALREEPHGVDRSDLSAIVHPTRTDAGLIHREVDR